MRLQQKYVSLFEEILMPSKIYKSNNNQKNVEDETDNTCFSSYFHV